MASIEGLYAVGQSTVGAAHAISDPISGRYDIHHGEAVGVLLPYVVKANYSYAEKEYETIKLIFEEKLGQTFRTLSEALDAFYAEIGFDRCALQREVDRTTFCSDFEELIWGELK